ncbi:hypothetical protein BJ684DRAFT_18927 [Piptocephalis cylindrospora]|uniref:Uncharacterized protein n=1 Tax=Piptocephalis cylindrospora TaxID=1907219 RepID=A0A4P9Y6M6_9FUNG|nr:hypothetical protein BJ684DRAFT_18927 [Piptocephalis cylindrospora]|eukprot:RKP14685.1 hypothetical protein BJ684DRAFT_18927 [Piptocephalis cylindrospora]
MAPSRPLPTFGMLVAGVKIKHQLQVYKPQLLDTLNFNIFFDEFYSLKELRKKLLSPSIPSSPRSRELSILQQDYHTMKIDWDFGTKKIQSLLRQTHQFFDEHLPDSLEIIRNPPMSLEKKSIRVYLISTADNLIYLVKALLEFSQKYPELNKAVYNDRKIKTSDMALETSIFLTDANKASRPQTVKFPPKMFSAMVDGTVSTLSQVTLRSILVMHIIRVLNDLERFQWYLNSQKANALDGKGRRHYFCARSSIESARAVQEWMEQGKPTKPVLPLREAFTVFNEGIDITSENYRSIKSKYERVFSFLSTISKKLNEELGLLSLGYLGLITEVNDLILHAKALINS